MNAHILEYYHYKLWLGVGISKDNKGVISFDAVV